jgi:5'(3')-deoxyribonucleotidase
MKTFLEYITEDSTTIDVELELPEIYLDMDETIVDWLSGANAALKHAGLPEWNDPSWKKQNSEEADKIKWDVLNNTPNFWENLKFMPDGKKIWNFVKKYKPKILSACGSNAKHCKDGKMRWLQSHLGLSNLSAIHLVPRSNKKNFAKVNNKKTVLIDDYDRNCIEFMSAGGIAIQATTGDSIIRELKKLGFR